MLSVSLLPVTSFHGLSLPIFSSSQNSCVYFPVWFSHVWNWNPKSCIKLGLLGTTLGFGNPLLDFHLSDTGRNPGGKMPHIGKKEEFSLAPHLPVPNKNLSWFWEKSREKIPLFSPSEAIFSLDFSQIQFNRSLGTGQWGDRENSSVFHI